MNLNTILDENVNGTKAVVVKEQSSREIDILEVKNKILEMNTALLTANPMMAVLLRQIHQQIRKDPELITIISEEEIGMIVNGLKAQTNTVIATTAVKTSKSASTKKLLSNLSADDL